MRININQETNQIYFRSKKTFKKMFNKCAYSGEKFENHDTRTIEHIIPVSEGGKNEYSNYIIVKKSWNEKRSSLPLDEFIKEYPEVEINIKNTLKTMEGRKVEGIDWATEVKKTLNKATGKKIF